MAIDVRAASQELVAQVRSEQFVSQVALALPDTVSPKRFARIAVTAIQQNPDLALCDRDTVAQALLKCAADGLLPDGREAAITKRRDNKNDRNVAVYMPMIGGLRKLAADYGWTLRTRAVRANDEFDWTEEPPMLTHRIARGDRGDLVYAYAIATRPDGTRLQRVLDANQIAQRKAKATTDKVWKEFPEAMWEKSAGRDIFDELPLSEVDRQRVDRALASERSFEDALRDPVAALYGRTNDSPASPAGDGAAVPADPGDPHPQEGSGTGSTGHDGGTGVPQASSTGAADPADEPIEEGEWEEAQVDEPALSEEAVAAAAAVKVPGGVHQGETLAEVAAGDDGERWLATQLKKLADDDRMRPAIETFVAGRLPDLWKRYETWKAEQA